LKKSEIFFNITVVIVVISAAIFCVNAQSNKSENEKIAEELMKLQRAEDKAEAEKDVAALEQIFNEDFIFIAANGAAYDKKKFIDEIRNDTEPTAQQTLDYENFKTRVYGKTAIVNYLLVVRGKSPDGKDFTNRYQMSTIWIKQKKAWRIINIQPTRVR
jgi:ketosteroid isomerase-like protein